MPFRTADLTDDFCNISNSGNCEDLQVSGMPFINYSAKPRFYGEIVTLKIFEDNQLLREQVFSDGEGKVLIVDGGGSLHRALFGDMLASEAVKNGWQGVLINGCIRDSLEMKKMPLGVMALGTHPLKTIKAGTGQTNVPISFAGLNFAPADFIYLDEDGIVIAEKPLI